MIDDGLTTEVELRNTNRYKFNEEALLKEIAKYIDATYNQHYSNTKFQATEYIVDQQQSLDFLLGNSLKYISRFGKKGGRNRKDILKAIHYMILALFYFDVFEKTDNS